MPDDPRVMPDISSAGAPVAVPSRSPPPVEEAEPEVRHPDGRVEHPRVRAESSDARFGVIAALLLLFVLAAPLHLYAVLALFRFAVAHDAAHNQSPYDAPPASALALPAEPRLEQIDRLAGIETPNARRRAAMEIKQLETSEPAADAGFERIPIERAMKLVPEQVTVRKSVSPAKPAPDGVYQDGDSNSGRRIRSPSP